MSLIFRRNKKYNQAWLNSPIVVWKFSARDEEIREKKPSLDESMSENVKSYGHISDGNKTEMGKLGDTIVK